MPNGKNIADPKGDLAKRSSIAAPRTKWTRATRAAARRAMARTGSVSSAALAAGVSPQTMLRWMETRRQFGFSMQRAHARYVAGLEKEAYRRAVHGVERQKPGPGGMVLTERQYSDKLLLHLLKVADRKRHGEQLRVEQQTTMVGALGLAQLSAKSRAELRAILEREVEHGDNGD